MNNQSNLALRKVLGISMILLILALLSAFMLVYIATVMPGTSLSGALPAPDRALIDLQGRLQAHVRTLADDIGPRHEEALANLERAADYLANQLGKFGYLPEQVAFGDGRFRNIVAELPGGTLAGEIIVLGAHYDSARTGTPGADDNASGVAALLEIARALAGRPMQRTVRLVFYPNEERPHFDTSLMGSRVDAARAAEAGDKIIGAFSLEMLGYYADEPDSQVYPGIVRPFYPDRGNFVAFVSNLDSRPLLLRAVAAFRNQQAFPSEGMAIPPALVPDIRRSDNSSYWYYGFPAVMVTDTSEFRTPHYHRASDTWDTLDYDGMARVVRGLTGMVIDLANTVE